MFSHSINPASFFSMLMAALIFSLSLAGVAAAQGNTSLGTGAFQNNTTGSFNTAIGLQALFRITVHFRGNQFAVSWMERRESLLNRSTGSLVTTRPIELRRQD
jgi:hypothetical protein